MKIKVFLTILIGCFSAHVSLFPHDISESRNYATEYALSNYVRQDYGADNTIHPVKLKDGSFKLPKSITNLPVYSYQFEVVRQKEQGTCGSRSVANALAVHDVLMNGLALDSAHVRTESLKYEHLHVKNGMTTREEIELAHKHGLKNCFCISLLVEDPINSDYLNKYPFTVIDSCLWGQINLYEETKFLEKINQLVRAAKTIDVHFLCHLDSQERLGGHGVVISVIKQDGMPTRMIYMDSNNIPLTEHCQAASYMEYVYWQFIA